MLTFFRITSWIEGLSYLLLLGIAMPLKYLWDYPQAVRLVGSAHGALTIVFLIAAVGVSVSDRWSFRRLAEALVYSVVPFGAFLFDRRLARDKGSLAQGR